MRKRLAVILTALLALFALSGCVKVDMELRLQPEDTLDGTIIMAFDKQMMEAFGMTTEDLMDQSGADLSDLPVGASVSPYDDGTFAGQQIDFSGTPIADFSDTGDTGLTIVREDDNYVVSGTFEGSGVDPSMAEGMELEMKITVVFPGPVASANGEISGNSVTWIPEPGVDTPIEAVGSAIASGGGGGGSSSLIFILVGIAVVAGGAIAFVLIRSKKKQTPPPGYGY